ncbi:MAG: terminase large subunit [Rhizobiales bacterium]|nr:terminase large subunit [Hyphomicrobiales bacterium]
MWDLSCPDWEDRIREGRSLIPNLTLNQAEAEMGLAMFDELRLPDVPGLPKMRNACGPWFRDIVRAAFGSWFPDQQQRYIRDIFAMLPKGQSKTTYCAGLLLIIMLMNMRPRAEALFVAPTQAIADNAYEKAVGMIESSEDLKRRFQTRDHLKTIVDRRPNNQSELKVRTFDVKILTGSILIAAMVDELHLLGRNQHTAKVLRQVRGGLEKTPEGLLLITTTQSDDIPAGAFRDELLSARKIRDGAFRGKIHRAMLPVLYEFPGDIAKDKEQWQDPENWGLVMPNLGRSVHLNSLIADWETEKAKNDQAIRIWASQHLNIEMGVGMKTDGWPGAEFWDQSEDETITIESMIERCEVIVPAADGGGLDDLFGLTLLGRDRATKCWLSWSHAWCHRGVLERRKSIASLLEQFAEAEELTIVDDKLDDLTEIVEIIVRVRDAGLLACVALDPEGPYGELVDALASEEITEEGGQIVGVPQGYKLMNAIKTTERKLANGTLRHAKSGLMDWCVQNVRIEPTATAIRATKQNAGDAKIDPWCALMDAATVMVKNPEAGRSVYDLLAEKNEAQPDADPALSSAEEAAILADPRHPQWQEMRDRWERTHLRRDEFEDAL